MNNKLFTKYVSIRLLAIVIAIFTIMGSYSFVVTSVNHNQWLSSVIFMAAAQLIVVFAMAVAAYILPHQTLILCWTYVVLVIAEIIAFFSGYYWVGFEPPRFQGEQLTLHLINREWGFRVVALILAFVALIFLHKNVDKQP